MERIAYEGDGQNVRFRVKLVGDGLASGKIRAACSQIFRRWRTLGRSFP
jgi:hypothetical protein